ncbi:putative peptidase C14 [Colletotrichum karsti]|uniref:Peptidase C14 n=1 Tax=Colletotrichum karsti TaxID=1095194 RepID=A0A9P6HXD6_9PEZI|nr:putative peptidase C14 [Colletotrichum karsti]KAF9872598.1 putative peptidase C14 [Colletotrichum karsti]
MPPRSLHHQRLLNREITITERADLHLVWAGERIFVKPLPRFLLEQSFWEKYLCPHEVPLTSIVHARALGFLFSYAALITHESDFRIAKEMHLLPEEVQWAAWRVAVGQLLGTPLRGYMSRWNQYGSFFHDNFALLASSTVYIAIVLTAMQVGLATEALQDNAAFQSASYGFTVFSIIVNRDSATGYSKDPVAIDTNHAGLNKFSSRENSGFQALEAAINKIRATPLIELADNFLLEKHYTSEKLKIKRLSGQELSMDQCYINLAIVEQVQKNMPSRDEEAKDSALKSSPFSLLARLRVETPAEHVQIQLKDIFSQRKTSGGTEISPRRVLIRGRAGVGKTTLCKKMVHDFVTSGMWRDLFDRVLWVPFRNLKERPASGYNLERLFFDEFFRPQRDKSGKLFAEETSKALMDNRTLFVLDGWDEVDRLANSNSDMSGFLRDLIRQPNVIITSRPSASVPVPDQQPIDLELETIGFNPTQVDEYIEKTHAAADTKKVNEIKTFLQSHELLERFQPGPWKYAGDYVHAISGH